MSLKNKSVRASVETLSQMSQDSSTSSESKEPIYFSVGDIRRRLTESVEPPRKKFEVEYSILTLRYALVHV